MSPIFYTPDSNHKVESASVCSISNFPAFLAAAQLSLFVTPPLGKLAISSCLLLLLAVCMAAQQMK